jgi:hypothetical protein
MELLLVGTPLENIMYGKPVQLNFQTIVTGGGAGLYERLLAYRQSDNIF